VIDAAANPSVLAGVDGQSSSRQVFDHNLSSTIHLLEYTVASDPAHRVFDIPWMVMDSRRAQSAFGWKPTRGLSDVLDEIARHAERHENWLELSGSL
jgi:CDP-paratose 2-epimerase